MADLLTRPDSRPDRARDRESLAERLLETQLAAAPAVLAAHPDRGRRPRRRGLRGPDDPRGLPRQRHRDPDPLLRAQAARLRGVPDVRRRGRGRGAPADLLLADVRAGDEGPDPDRGDPPAAPDEPRADLQRPQRLLPAALPEQVPEPHRHPGLPQGQRRGRLAREHADLQAHDPVPVSVLGRVCPAPCEEHCRRDEVDEAIAIRDSHRYAGDQVLKAMLDEGVDPPLPFERQAPTGRRAAVIGSGPAGMAAAFYLLLVGPRRDGLRARPGARRDAPLRHPAVPPAQGRGPRGRVRVGHPARRQDRLQRRPRPRLHARRPDQPGLRRGRRRDRLLRHEQARASRARTPPRSSTASSTCAPRRSACRTRTTPASASSSSAAGSPRWTARGPRSARAPAR